LALVIAAEGRPTLLVDADLRAPRLHRLLGIDEGPGFADLLAACQRQQNPEPWSEPQRVAPDLDVLPAGSAGIPVGTLLRPATLQAAMAALTARYEIVILAVTEQPPAPDALLVAGAAGTAILTVAAGSATQDELRRLRVRLERAGVSLLGFSYVEGA
jgi:Mrp family chromosome partitioning ATPase